MLQTKDYKVFQVGDQTFEGGDAARPALPGDWVDFVDGRIAVRQRATHKNIVGVLEVASKARFGFTKRGTPIYLFSPWNESYPPFYCASTVKDCSKNLLICADFLDWEPGTNLPRADCREILGICGDLAAEEAALLRHACPSPWKLKDVGVLADRAAVAATAATPSAQTFHVDPPGCRDIDDAITIWQLAEEEWEIHIHIADVATLLATNSWLGTKAAQLGQTLYRDGAVITGMLPAVAEAACSLLPHEMRNTLTLAFQFTEDGIITDTRWLYEQIQVKESYTYDTIGASMYAPILKDLASTIKGQETADPHEWIEQLMLFYNKEAAQTLHKAGKGILRRHSEPDWNMLSSLEGLGKFDIPLFLAYKAGEYCAASDPNTQHWGLHAEFYTHASSPIRRWADCINQTALLNILFGAALPDLPGSDPKALNALAKSARAYERDLFFVRTLLGANAQIKPLGVVLEFERDTNYIRVWVDAWKRIIIAKPPLDGWCEEPVPGDVRRLSIYYDPTQRNWKRRMVVQMHLSDL